jgi:hypothetical protein
MIALACSTNEQVSLINISATDEINKSIIDGFYDNDTTGIGDKIYLLKK